MIRVITDLELALGIVQFEGREPDEQYLELLTELGYATRDALRPRRWYLTLEGSKAWKAIDKSHRRNIGLHLAGE